MLACGRFWIDVTFVIVVNGAMLSVPGERGEQGELVGRVQQQPLAESRPGPRVLSSAASQARQR